MPISRDEVRHIAMLARLGLSDGEVEKFTHQLSDILDHAQVITGLTTEGIEPLIHAVDQRNIYRKDEVKEGLKPEEALQNAPSKEDDSFKIPPII